ncbi:thioredoxin domain-containing protein PLP3A [Zea mays]|nr:thioredoxin domain-containing protein PLP3A [Zea mays]|eukprot:XP_020397890.1 thioredoxin domain-containing protein PLP3A [Zea mays]
MSPLAVAISVHTKPGSKVATITVLDDEAVMRKQLHEAREQLVRQRYELGCQPANTKLSSNKTVRRTLVKSAIVQVDAAPFKQWYLTHYGVDIGRKKKVHVAKKDDTEFFICHFYHREFYRCKIMDKHLKTLAPIYVGTKFVKLDVENAPFFVAKLAIKILPCVILFKKGIVVDRLVGIQDLRSKDDFLTRALEHILILKTKGIIDEKKKDDDDADEESEANNRRVKSSTAKDSDSD